MRNILQLALKLLVICFGAGLALSVTNGITKDEIDRQAALQAEQARMLALPAAETFEEIENPAGLDSAFRGVSQGATVGYVGALTVRGYAGDVEVTVGIDTTGVITGISVGGSNFQETVGLGAKVKEQEFTGQFNGKVTPLTVKQEIVPITGATISSRAVTEAVNKVTSALLALGEGQEAPAEQSQALTMAFPEADEFVKEENLQGDVIAYQAVQGDVIGYVGTITVKGYSGNVEVTVGMGLDGRIIGVHVGGDEFKETSGIGTKVQESAFLDQYKEKTAPLTLGEGVEAVSGATVSSETVNDAVNAVCAVLRDLIGGEAA